MGSPGSASSVSTGLCTLDAAGSSVNGSGNTLTVTFQFTFEEEFAGTKNLYLVARDQAEAITGWDDRGNLTVTAA